MKIKNLSNKKILANKAWMCRSLTERLRGLMFKRINPSQGCVLVNPNESVLDSSIHMMFVPQDLEIIWADSDLQVVKVKKCKRATLNPLTWRSYYPNKPAKYVIELLDAKNTLKGDKIRFIK